MMSPSDKIKGNNSNAEEDQTQETSKISEMNTTPELSSTSASDFVIPGTISSIPLITASLPTLKCSINNQMKTFDPGEDSGIERLNRSQFGSSVCTTKSSNINKGSNKNYKAGSKINKLADMLAKRSQNVVEVSQNNSTDITNTNSVTKVEKSVSLNNVSDIMNLKKCLKDSEVCFTKAAKNNELDVFKKSRRKSVPNQSYNLNHMHLQSTSKSCSDFSKLFLMDENVTSEFNALGVSLINLQTDESTKRKAIKKSLKNVELTLILPEKKKRSYIRNVFNSKIEKQFEASSKEEKLIDEISKNSESCNEIVTSSVSDSFHSVSCTKVKKDIKGKKAKSKRLVETSTQTPDLEFITAVESKLLIENSELKEKKPIVNYNCLYCTRTFSLELDCKAHEKTHVFKNSKQFIKCQYCSKKLSSLEELKSHCVKKHPNKYAYCMKCDNRFSTKEKLYSHNKEVHLIKNLDNVNKNCTIEKKSLDSLQEKKKDENEEKQTEKKINKQSQNGSKNDLKIDVSFDSSKKSSISPRNIQKCSPKEIKTEEQLLEMEMLFYSQLSGNIQENLTNHLDGKIDKNGNPVRTDQIKELVDSNTKAKSINILSLASPSTGASDIHVHRAPSPYQTRSKTPNPLPPTAKKFKKLPNWQQKFWEKYNFPTNYRYEHKFWDKNYLNTEKSAFYLKDLSCLDIKTQLIMRESIKKLDNIEIIEENTKPIDKLKFPDYLSLISKENCGSNYELRNELSKRVSEVKGNQIRHFKPPGPELPTSKTRRKLSTDNSSPGKKQNDRINSEGIKMITRSQSSIDLLKDDKEEDMKKKIIGLNISENQRMTLRKQTSLDSLKKSTEFISEKNNILLNNGLNSANDFEIPSTADLPELSGEWVRPKTYLCGACCMKFTNLWELEDHKWVSHPNVWCTHYEFEDEKIENLFQINEDESKESNDFSSFNLKLTDLYKRYLLPHGSLKTAKLVPSITFPEQCTKCKKSCMNSPELHKHMLDCGGDTSWFLTMYSSPLTIKRRWRPFGSRRRKQLGRRDLKRNLSSTSSIRSYPYRPRIRTKPGDIESIQKMLANLPEKRARRVINFDDIKTRSQATIHSNRLLRKRFKSTFATNFLKLKNLKQRRQLKQGKKEGSSKSTTDASSESTPIGSPKRRNKLKEGLQGLGEENSTDFFSENSLDSLSKSRKRRSITTNDQNILKGNKKKISKRKNLNEKNEKPATRKNGINLNGKEKNKICHNKEEPSSFIESLKVNLNEVEDKILKKQNKNSFGTLSNIFLKEEINSDIPEMLKSHEKQIKKLNKKIEKNHQKVGGKNKNDQFVDNRSKAKQISRYQAKEKAELLHRMKKKVQNSKRILRSNECEKTENGKRRSLRIKFQQSFDDNPEADVEAIMLNGKIVENNWPYKDINNSGYILEDFTGKKSSTTATGKKSNEETENNNGTVSLVRRSSRSLLIRSSMSVDEKIDFKSNTLESEGEFSRSKVALLRRNSNINSRKSANSRVAEKLSRKKLPQKIQSVDFKSLSEKLDTNKRGQQISTFKKNFVQNSELTSSSSCEEKVKLLNLGEKNVNSDLEEMPILAKVEPLRGKVYAKNEYEIPVLMPVEKKPQLYSSFNKDENQMNFQMSKKRRSTSLEMSPIKVIKTENSVSLGKIEKLNNVFAPKNISMDDSLKKIKKKKISNIFDQKTVSIEKKFRRSSTEKKYFLGICPGEIDKGKEKYNDESGSDSEPLSALINNNQKMNPNTFAAEGLQVLQTENSNMLENKIPQIETEKLLTENEKEGTTTNFEFRDTKTKVLEPSDISKNIAICESSFVKKIRSKGKNKKKTTKKKGKRLRLTLTLKEPTLEVEAKPSLQLTESMWTLKMAKESVNPLNESTPDLSHQETSPQQPLMKNIELSQLNEVTSNLPKRRSRRISKEIKSTNEFIIDDPLILVDELWSELDSDSDSSKKKSKKGKKKFFKKKTSEEKKTCDVNLEELLRNFGENKETGSDKKNGEQLPLIPVKIKKNEFFNQTFSIIDIRKSLENRIKPKSYKRLSLKLFQFNKTLKNFGNRGWKLCDARKVLKKIENEKQSNKSHLPDLPFLATEIKENPVQVIQCRSQKSKTIKKASKKPETKCHNNIRFKISLPLESISNIAIFNNNNLTELVVEEPTQSVTDNFQVMVQNVSSGEEKESFEFAFEKENQMIQEEFFEMSDIKNKTKRSEVIDKIFYCEICKTYYYSSSQLKIHKQSNRHKLKESEIQLTHSTVAEKISIENAKEDHEIEPTTLLVPYVVNNITGEPICHESLEVEKLNDDTLEMPILEGPFIENPMSSLEPVEPAPQLVSAMANLGLTQESLKDIQRAIGCTDEEMLILTLLGENTLEVENDILDLNSCKSIESSNKKSCTKKIEKNDWEKDNGIFKIDLKQRMTSALSCLVNKAVFNLLRKYETMAKSSINPEALSLLGKLSSFSKSKNILQFNDLLKRQKVGEPSFNTICRDLEKKVPAVSYKYQCTICGNRFEKASTREFHISRTHKGKAKKLMEKTQVPQIVIDEEWNDSWNYSVNGASLEKVNNSQFLCSDCGINFLSPQEVIHHQKLEHQTGFKTSKRTNETGPLQSSTIGSSDEVIEEKKPKKKPKLFSSEELNQQRILANNELRKLDRKFANKNKTNKKWGMDALRFTVEKENKMIVVKEGKEDNTEKLQNLDLIPKLNLSRTNNIPEFKVIQKNSLKNRFQKIIDNKLKRRSNQRLQENEKYDVENEMMLVPVVVKKRNKKFKRSKVKKNDGKKNVDVYDFNDSESENEPVIFSRVKKPSPLSKLKLVKTKEAPSKNKADSTTKDLGPDDYDSEDSLPLSIVKKSKAEYEEDEKEEKVSDNGLERSEGILEQVEYLIEQLENETIHTEQKNEPKIESDNDENRENKIIIENKERKVYSNTGLRVSLTNKLLELQDLTLKTQKNNGDLNDSILEEISKNEIEKTALAEPESNQSTFDEEDSIPLVHISKKFDECKLKDKKNKSEDVTDVPASESEDTILFFADDNNKITKSDADSGLDIKKTLPAIYLSSENEIEKLNKNFETLNGNVIYCRNDSVSDFESDFSNDELIDFNFEKTELKKSSKEFIKEVTEKEDVVIVCSKGEDKKVKSFGGNKKKVKSPYQKKDKFETVQKKKRRIPLLTATIDKNNFRKSESPKLNKEVIVRKIWNRRKLLEEASDNDSFENIQNDDSQTEIDKEFIMKKIWSRKKLDLEVENERIEEKLEDVKINQTEISDEVIIKCGPKTKISSKRRKSKSSTNECAKETIMRKIWSGKCTFQTKAALKTYDSDVMPNSEENEMSDEQPKQKKRGRPSVFSSNKKSKIENVDKDDDDLDSLLEEIEREQLEKAIRSEFLQLRRSEKGNIEILKEGPNSTIGLFTETSISKKKNASDRKRKKLKKNIKHPRQSLLTRKRYLKKPIRRVFPMEEKLYNENSFRTISESVSEIRENVLEKKVESFNLESKIKTRKHKKHRHKHHHHKHKHKKSKHHKCILNKHKNKHKFNMEMDVLEKTNSFTILEKICQDIPNQIENETRVKEKTLQNKEMNENSNIDCLMSPFSFEDSTKDDEEDGFDNLIPGKAIFQNKSQNICDFVEEISNF